MNGQKEHAPNEKRDSNRRAHKRQDRDRNDRPQKKREKLKYKLIRNVLKTSRHACDPFHERTHKLIVEKIKGIAEAYKNSRWVADVEVQEGLGEYFPESIACY